MLYGFRTKETSEAYEKEKATGAMEKECVLCSREPLKEFRYWKIIKNNFPYDRIAKVHHMLVTKKHKIESELSEKEKKELLTIKSDQLDKEYRFIFESVPSVKSLPTHHHLHLIVEKDEW